jgi:hypothetical protein
MAVRAFSRVTIAVGLLVAAVLGAPQANAAATGVAAKPASWTPYITSPYGYVRLIRTCGANAYAVGTFTKVAGPNQAAVTRNNAFSFNASTGQITSWNPNVNGTVYTIAFSPDCSYAYLGGQFTAVGSTTVKNIVKVSTSTGAVTAGFGHSASAKVMTLVMTASHLIAGGYFGSINGSSTKYIASLDPTTGKNDGYVTIPVSGTVGTYATSIYKFALSNSGTRLLVSGAFSSVAGQPRQQIFMLDLGATSATLDPWYSTLFNGSCAAKEAFYVKGFTWSPDDARVYIATTGYKGSALCDVAAAFSSSASSSQPALWINKTGCDSLYATAADATDVYIGGHERWADNPNGCDAAGPGAVSRPGIGDIDPVTGLATPWNPTRSRGKGAVDMYIDPSGNLWVSSDNGNNTVTRCGGAYHPGICMFPHA